VTDRERVLVVDAGTSSVRVAVFSGARIVDEHRRLQPPSSPAPGLVEFDAADLAAAVLELARASLDDAGPVAAVGIANQRGSAVLWDRATGAPVAPAIGWQDVRTVGRCLALRDTGWKLAPNHAGTKLEALLDEADPDRRRDLCFGTVDSWVAWTLSGGRLHVTDASNALVTGLRRPSNDGWRDEALEALRIPVGALPAVVDSEGVVGPADALPGRPPIAGILGDQQASLLGQACVRPGEAKITFGTGGMLDVVLGPDRPGGDRGGGTFPIVTRRRAGRDRWGLEAVMLSAGTAVEWLRDLGLIGDAAASHDVAARCGDTGDVWFVPALHGLGTPAWDYGARGALLGLTRGTTAAQVVRAVLEGVAHRGADLVDAATLDAGTSIATLRVDGGLSANPTFVQALADAAQRPVEVSPVREATALGAAFAAGLAVGIWPDDDAIAGTWAPEHRVEPTRPLDRDRWRAAVERARGWIPELSALAL
jgi:glycerol kinase